MIPSLPGFTYIEGWFDHEDKFQTHKHPVIGWVEAHAGSYSRLSLLPIMMVTRAGDDEDDYWAVQYPDRGMVITNQGGVFDNISQWISHIKELRELEAERVKEDA